MNNDCRCGHSGRRHSCWRWACLVPGCDCTEDTSVAVDYSSYEEWQKRALSRLKIIYTKSKGAQA